jgi:hypothetical protein
VLWLNKILTGFRQQSTKNKNNNNPPPTMYNLFIDLGKKVLAQIFGQNGTATTLPKNRVMQSLMLWSIRHK